MSENISTSSFVIQEKDGSCSLNLLVDGMHCPSCVAIIESALKKEEKVIYARLNLSTKRLKISWNGAVKDGDDFVRLINKMGYKAVPFDAETSESSEKKEEKFLLRCLAVAGFASGNLMLFSVPLWTSDGVSMGGMTRNFFYWIQAAIAMPAIIYCGRPFYRSAWRAVKEGHTNMDVPISVAVILATAMSLFETLNHGLHSYFDSGVMLLFFLLIGRYLDFQARGKARSAAHDLLQMMTGFATILNDDGSQTTIPLSDIKEGMVLLVAAGEKIGADGEIIKGVSELDTSLITGETIPQKIEVGGRIFAGTINISAPFTMRVTKAGERSLLAEIIRLMEHAEQSQARYVTIADKLSGWYTPVVHLLAAGTFAGWYFYAGVSWQAALLYAATVLIITCPCALGLAVPVVQVLASGKLMKAGILIKSGSALERIAEITHVVFDKTGTLTLGKPELINPNSYKEERLQLAASLAVHSKHPLSRAICDIYKGKILNIEAVEIPGFGLQANYQGKIIMLGKRDWCGKSGEVDKALELWLSDGQEYTRFIFADKLREDAKETVNILKANQIQTLLFSGDRREVVKSVADELGIESAYAVLSPTDKCKKIEELKLSGAKVLMAGDGLNDAPSLAVASVSISPASAIEITQNAADIVFQGDKLKPVVIAWETAKFAQELVKQNFMLATLYNIIAIPMAVFGYVTPLIAAIAMSSSSLVVIVNAMRLNLRR